MFHVFTLDKMKEVYKKIFDKIYLWIVKWILKNREGVADVSTVKLTMYIRLQLTAFNPETFIAKVKSLSYDRSILARHGNVFEAALELERMCKQLAERGNLRQLLSASGLHNTSAMKFLTDKDGCYYDCQPDIIKFKKHLEELLNLYPTIEAGTESTDLNNQFLLQHYLRDIKKILKSWSELE